MCPSAYVDESLRSFLVKLSNRTPEPAGGAALALAGASAAALMSLACHLPSAEHPTEPRGEALLGCQRCSETLLHRIQVLIDADVTAYREVVRCLRLPHSNAQQSSERQESLDGALREATEVPLQVAEAGLEILDLAASVAGSVRDSAAGDLAAAVHLAEAAVRGSLRNARINASSVSAAAYAEQTHERVQAMSKRLGEAANRTAITLRARGVPE
jgi:methenyltetrahydrofolate cyclohydrolase